jgi:predicted ATPase
VRAGIAAMRATLDAADAMCSRLFRPIQLGTLASAHARLGEIDVALPLVDEALALAARTGERRADPALHRLRGELMLAVGERRKGMHELQHALTVARSQLAKAEEGRIESAIASLQQSPARKAPFGALAMLRALFAMR